MKRGLVVSAPSSGAGKTTVTLGLLRALRDRGVDVVSAKTGPDYIDPAFHTAATGRACLTLDPWCADAAQLRARAGAGEGAMLVVEGAMGLFDGAPDPASPLGRGSTGGCGDGDGDAGRSGRGCGEDGADDGGGGCRAGRVSRGGSGSVV